MRTLSCILAGGLLLVAQPGAAAEHVVTNPDWLERPDAEKVAEAFPQIAQMLGLEGRTTLSCDVNAKGVLEHCVVLSESPAGLGFGPATLTLAKTFRMKPKTVDGVPVDGGTVRIPMVYKLPPRPKPDTSTVTGADVFGAPSALGLQLARQVVDTQDLGSEAQVQMELSLLDLGEAKMLGVDAATRQDAVTALRTAYAADMELMKTDIVRAYASTFSEAELEDMATFFSSPGGRALKLRGSSLGAAMIRLGPKHSELVLATARKAFCEKHPCEVVANPPAPPETAPSKP